jgi:drug/metabolite transporter (DMT)-like permease
MNTSTSSSFRPLAAPVLAAAAVAVTVLSWASAFPFIRVALQGLPPMQLAAARFATAAILVAGWLAYRRPKLPSTVHLVRFGLCGLIGIALYNALLNTGEMTVAAGAASFIVNTLPIFTALLAKIFLGERFNRWAWFGSFFSLAGIGLIAHGQPGGLAPGAGASMILGAALCAASYFVLQRRLIPVYGALACTAYTLLAGALLLSPWLPAAIESLSVAPTGTLRAVLILGIFPAAIGYATWTFALGYFGATRAANFLYLTPAVAMGLSVVMTGEQPGVVTLLGGLMAIGGVVFVVWRGRR